MEEIKNQVKQTALIWDVPTRVFHWLLALTFTMAFVSHDDNRYLDIHVFAGYSFFALLLFRVVWGMVGTHYARFKQFSYPPKQVFSYLFSLLTPQRQHYVGHNPAGSWAIYVLLVAGLVLGISGLIVLGGEEQHGPLAGVLSFRQSAPFHEIHELVAFGLLLLVAVHICGVVVESILHRENLVTAMLRGKKYTNEAVITVAPYVWLGATLLIAIIAYAAVFFAGYVTQPNYVPFHGKSLVQSPVWQKNCGECHLAFHPSLLPARSWQALLNNQDKHFGEDLALEPEVVAELKQYAQQHAADLEQTEVAWRMNSHIPAQQSPLRMTEVSYWKDKHQDIKAEVWQQPNIKSKANCDVCHQDAKLGTFEDAAMRIPPATFVK